MSQAPEGPAPGPAEPPDLGALSDLAPELARTFVSIASDIALVIDSTGVIRNVAVGKDPITGAAAGWVGQRWADTVTGDTQRKIEQLLSEVNSAGVTRRREVSHAGQGGPDVPVAYAAIRLGRDGPVLAVGRDLRAVAAIQQRFIDTQRELERDYWRQRQSESRYRLLFQVATDAVLVVDAQSLRIVDANRAAGVLFGCASEALVGRGVPDGVAPAARPGVQELLIMARATGRPAEMRAPLDCDGDTLPSLIELSATPLRAEDHMLLLVRARTMESGAAAAGEAVRLADFVERTPDALAIADASGRLLMANPAFVSLCQRSGEAAVLGQALADLLDDRQQRLPALLSDARRHGIAEQRRVGELEISAALLAEGDQECIGLTLRRIDTRLADVPPQVGDLAAAIDRLAAQMGLATLPELMQEASDLAERHLLDSALARVDGDPLLAAKLLGISPENLWLRLRHHRLGVGGPGSGNAAPNLLN
ncbi:transcriptional regulator PpsR [Ideonella sp. A 288]|uniref:transcriptional regulator PpsR n=1 Tax=Ideonella sp. A 288 TaxID=1962181 RepID=UPI00130384B6|nr:transcriptional regulator PpsR [Ideonella sp. A 288]